jgi:hypothetical protein
MNDMIWISAKQEYLSSGVLRTMKIRNTPGVEESRKLIDG